MSIALHYAMLIILFWSLLLLQKLAASCDVLSEKCVKVVKEQELQLQGWSAAVANSNTVLG